MFKEIYKRFDDLKSYIRGQIDFLVNMCDEIRTGMKNINTRLSDLPKISRMENTIESQQRTIEQLTNALKDKYEHGLFIFSDDCKTPMVIRNGENVIGKYTKWFRIEWTPGEAPTIETEQMVGTFSGEDD